ncbi:MAG: amidohydrolase [Armatimonadetes bacterium]|nr:amidohydrolase [Armatimonadota bacterium]
MMIIDSHVHLRHGDATCTEYSPETIVEVMDAVGIQRSVVFAICCTSKDAMERASDAVAKFPDRLIPYAYALPNYERPVLDELREAIGQRGFKGIKIHIGECRLPPWIIEPVMRLAGSYGVPCLIDFAGDARSAERLARLFPETKLIIAHFGRYRGTDVPLIDTFIGLAEKYPNVWFDTSGVPVSWKIEDAVRRIGASRILFGTDGPHPTPTLENMARLAIEHIRMLSITEEEKAWILGGSAAALLGL